MIDQIYGKVIKVKKDSLILKINNLAFEIITPNPYLIEEGKHLNFYTFLKFKSQEEEFKLYGFLKNEIREFFLKLISVQGIGAKTAILILGKDDPLKIKNEILNQNIKYLSSLPHVGFKMAEKIVLELKDKLEFSNIKNNESKEILLSTLKSLGYSDKKINQVLFQIKEDSISNMIKNAIIKLQS